MTRTILLAALALVTSLAASLSAASNADAQTTAEVQPDRVIAMYFHRTERCPTCKMMGSYSEEAVKTGFPEQLKKGTVEFKMIDYEKKENADLAKAYKIKGPALIVAKIEANKVKEYKDLREIWSKVREKAEYIAYVQENVKIYAR
ncbi:hypothetical protein SAMN06265222_101773 [Neorhodopirellula lusitana]|uniref:Thioredoxin domain-containing protein n=1 Tax=Neorhodopirellula lusitana TaxID=445327 RepID=A0ABY1PT59_9BACT|nr:nitrophenyl compound nitroreductase subunit ArsF family protein [Neorhodopirellula lusitana]SMP42384.1 hypothetical protein SAMN06265222_101773 [Neorhodopirellula lusitana]